MKGIESRIKSELYSDKLALVSFFLEKLKSYDRIPLSCLDEVNMEFGYGMIEGKENLLSILKCVVDSLIEERN